MTVIHENRGGGDFQTDMIAGRIDFQFNGAPAKTPKAIIDRLQKETVAAVQSAEHRARAAALIADPAGSTPKEFAAHLRAEYERYGKVIKETGARAE